MKKRKKLTSAILAFCVCVSLAGCGNTNSSTDNDVSNENNSVNNESADSEVVAESDLNHESFSERLLGMRDNLPVKMSEFLITSYESPIIGVDVNGKPVYEYDQSEIKNERYLQIKEGIMDYIDDQRHFFEPRREYLLSLEEWIDLADAYLRDCSEEEIESLSQIIDSENPVSSDNDKTIADLIRSYRELGY